MTDRTHQTPFPALDGLGAEIRRVARTDAQQQRRPRLWRVGIALAAGIIAVPAGYAVAHGVLDGGSDGAVPASDCPEANAVFQEWGLPVPDDYGPGCPTAQETEAQLKQGFVSNEEIAAEEPQPAGEWSQNLDQADRFDRAFRNGETLPDVEERQALKRGASH